MVSSKLLRSRHFPASFLCVLVFVIAIALTRPFVEIATDDDWSYALTARIFASTGHVVYNGWATAMLGWQIAWGALFIKLFGFSFFVLRVSSTVLGMAIAFLLHRVLLRFGVSSFNAVVGTLTMVLCPLFVPMAVTFMTDVPSVFCLVLCLYGCQRALRAADDRKALLWLCGSAALNVLDGTVRQIVWLGALVIVPSTFWLLRRRRHFPVVGAVTWLVSFIGVQLFLGWFQHQPYSLPEHLLSGAITGGAFDKLRHDMWYMPLDTILFTLPILVAWLPRMLTLQKTGRSLLVIFLAGLGPLLLWADHAHVLVNHLPPWTGHVVTQYGILESLPTLGPRPTILSIGLRTLVIVIYGFSVLGFGVTRFHRQSSDSASDKVSRQGLNLYETGMLVVPFCVAYMMLLLTRAAFPSMVAGFYDRYYIPLVLMAVILLLRLYESDYGKSLPDLCVVTLAAFTFFSIAGTHDLFAAYRGLDTAIGELRRANVPATSIGGGWEYDGWNQLATEGHLNDDRLINPPGAYRAVAHPPLENCNYWFGSRLPAIHPKYVVVTDPIDCLEVSSEFPAVSYKTWLPPYDRHLIVQRNPAEK